MPCWAEQQWDRSQSLIPPGPAPSAPPSIGPAPNQPRPSYFQFSPGYRPRPALTGPALAPPAQAQFSANPEVERRAQTLFFLSRLGILDAPQVPDPPHPRFRGRHVS